MVMVNQKIILITVHLLIKRTYPIKFINTFIESLNDQNIFFINCNTSYRTKN